MYMLHILVVCDLVVHHILHHGITIKQTMHCMIVLNAPSFFTMSWGVVKQLIDPRTAKRIQLFGSQAKGVARMLQLIDPSEIPADYGGTKPSIERIVQAESSGTIGAPEVHQPQQQHQEIDLLFCKRRGKVHKVFEVAVGQTLRLRIWTRSVSGVKFALHDKHTGEKKMRESVVRGDIPERSVAAVDVGAQAPATALPRCVELVSSLSGPGKFVLEGQDLDDVSKELSSLSRGYFLIVGEIS
jgi:CRAL/TRIO domain